MANLQRLGLVVLALVAAVLCGLLMASPAQAYGGAGGAVVSKQCTFNSTTGYPSHNGCAASVGDVREGDVGYAISQLEAANPTTDYQFYAWLSDCVPTKTSGTCSFTLKRYSLTGSYLGTAGGSLSYTVETRNVQDCAVGGAYTQVSGSCYCAPGYAPQADGTCVPSVCPVAGTEIPGTDGKGFGYDNMVSGGTLVCFDGCLIAGSYGVGYSGKWFILGPFYNVGQQCNPSNQGGTYPPAGDAAKSGAPPIENNPNVDCAAGQCKGTVNGTQVCVACDSTSTGGYDKGSGGQGSGGTITKTTCSNGVCTTTTTTVDGNGNAGTPSGSHTGSGGSNPQANPGGTSGAGNCTGSDCQSTPSFCEDNPESPICKESTWGGSCESSFTCDGDEVQCAIAKEQHMRNCTLFVTHTDLSDMGNEATQGGDQPVGHPFKDAQSTSVDFGTKIDMANPLTGSCPAGRSVTVAGHSLVLVTAGLCDSLAMVGNIIVAFGALCAVFIVFKG